MSVLKGEARQKVLTNIRQLENVCRKQCPLGDYQNYIGQYCQKKCSVGQAIREEGKKLEGGVDERVQGISPYHLKKIEYQSFKKNGLSDENIAKMIDKSLYYVRKKKEEWGINQA